MMKERVAEGGKAHPPQQSPCQNGGRQRRRDAGRRFERRRGENCSELRQISISIEGIARATAALGVTCSLLALCILYGRIPHSDDGRNGTPFDMMLRSSHEGVGNVPITTGKHRDQKLRVSKPEQQRLKEPDLDVGGLRRDPITVRRNHTESPTCHPYFLVGTEGPKVLYENTVDQKTKHKAVLTYMTYENRVEETKHSLILLEHYFLRRHHYPVHIFYENLNETILQDLAALIPSAISVAFERTCFEKNTPLGSPSFDEAWKMLRDLGMGWPGYAQMCRFYSGTIFMLPSLLKYDYYWRLDTDLYLLRMVERDPFDSMRATNCSYSYYDMEIDWEIATQKLWSTTVDWFDAHSKPILKDHAIGQEHMERAKSARLKSNGKYDRKGYKTHFTVSAFAPFRSDIYLSLFRYLDASMGFYRYRWGDLPILGIGVPLMLEPSQICKTDMSVSHRINPKLLVGYD